MTVVPMPENDAVEPKVKTDRAVILTALCAMFVAAWAYLLSGAGLGLSAMNLTVMYPQLSEETLQAVAWTPVFALKIMVIWLVLAIAIVVPAAAPIVLLHAAQNRKSRDPVNVSVFCGLFLFGYMAVWGLLSLMAAGVQWTLEQSGLMTQALSISDPRIVGGLFIAAGAYQFTSAKLNSLKHIRRPDQYIFHDWRDGPAGALKMGFGLGATFAGSCWLLIALMYSYGILNIIWIAGLAGYIMLEKLSPHGRVISIMAGSALACWGIFVLAIALQP